jgi:hypothetical protein
MLNSSRLDCNRFYYLAVRLNTEYTKIFIGLDRILHFDTSAKYIIRSHVCFFCPCLLCCNKVSSHTTLTDVLVCGC